MIDQRSIEMAREVIGEVARDLALSGPVIDATGRCYRFAYFGRVVGFEIVLEMGEIRPDVIFFRNGHERLIYRIAKRIPILFHVFGYRLVPAQFRTIEGIRQKVYLNVAMAEMGIPALDEIERMKRLGDDVGNFEALVRIQASLLRTIWPYIDDKSSTLFGSSR